MSEGFANCFCGQPRVNPPLNPSAGQSGGCPGAAVCWAKLVVLTPVVLAKVVATSTAAAKDAFTFMIVCPPNDPSSFRKSRTDLVPAYRALLASRGRRQTRSDQNLGSKYTISVASSMATM